MAVLNFPVPTTGGTYSANGITYTYDGEKWIAHGDNSYVNLGGAAMDGSVTVPERVIESNSFDLSTGPYWTAGAISIPNPTNAIAGMGGLIRLTGEPISWGNYFKFAGGEAPSGTGTLPFYVESSTYICLGKVTPGA